MHRPMLAVAACLLLAAGCGPSATPTPAGTATPNAEATREARAGTAVVIATAEAIGTETEAARPTKTTTPTAAPETATRANPLPLGEPYVLELDGGGTASVSVKEVVTGAAANAMLKQANQFNDDPDPGTQHVMVKLSVRLDGENIPEVWTTVNPTVWSVVANGKAIDGSKFVAMVMPEPKFEGEIIPPGEIEGWTYFNAPETDDLSVVFLRTLDRGGYWWKAAP